LPIEDSLDSILDTLKYTGKIFKTGGGVGINFSPLRPKNCKIKTNEGQSSGVVSFMEILDAATERIKQGGVRRGAMIGILNINHPEIREFITAKSEEGILSNFNISVSVTDKFMDAVEKDKDIELTHPEMKESIKIKAKELWNIIIENAWKNGEPGIIFIDRINEFNTLPGVGPIQAVNPCGELPLFPFESCNLGSINLVKMLKPEDGVDWDKLERTVELMVRFLDDVIEVNKLPLEEIDKMTKANRKIGLGIMGWADMLISMKLRYDTKEAFKLADKLISFIKNAAFEASKDLAKERGAFPNFKQSIYWDQSKRGSKFKLRNATLLSIAPTGTLSAIAGVSSGI
jgi:ribonucleoside-diphosphate reductase alpha chain